METTNDDVLLPQTRDYLDIEQQYDKLMFFYEAAISQIESRLNIIKREYQILLDRNPIENVKSRIKKTDSLLRKMEKKGLPMTISAMTNNIYDIAGIRIICPFVSDVYDMAKTILRQQDIEMLEIKDYIRDPKENGYRSLHLIVSVSVQLADGIKNVPVEIQIRTIAMNFWASTEHQLRYKKDRIFTEEMQQQMKRCADIMADADKNMQQIAGAFYNEQW